MASAAEVPGLEAFEDLLNCAVCLETYDKPKLLHCGHTFCLRCIKEFHGGKPSIKCPLCTRKTSVPDQGLTALTDDFRVGQFRDSICKALHSPSKSPGKRNPSKKSTTESPVPANATQSRVPANATQSCVPANATQSRVPANATQSHTREPLGHMVLRRDLGYGLRHMSITGVPEFKIKVMGTPPDGWRLATYQEVTRDLTAFKRHFKAGMEWHICQLLDGRAHGPGYKFDIQKGLTKDRLGHMVIIKKDPDDMSITGIPEFRIKVTGTPPDGWRLATYQEVTMDLTAFKRQFKAGMEWHICQLLDGRAHGPGYKFDIQKGLTKDKLGHMVIIKKDPE